MTTKQSRPQSSGLQDMGRCSGVSLPVTGAQYRWSKAAFTSCLAWHGPKHHCQCSWWMASASSCLCASKGGHYEHLLWHYQYAYLYNYVTWNVLCCVKYDMIAKAYFRWSCAHLRGECWWMMHQRPLNLPLRRNFMATTGRLGIPVNCSHLVDNLLQVPFHCTKWYCASTKGSVPTQNTLPLLSYCSITASCCLMLKNELDSPHVVRHSCMDKRVGGR